MTMKLQESINATASGDQLELPPGEFFGQLISIDLFTATEGQKRFTYIKSTVGQTAAFSAVGLEPQNLVIPIRLLRTGGG